MGFIVVDVGQDKNFCSCFGNGYGCYSSDIVIV